MTLAVAMLLVPFAADDDAAKKDLEKFQGNWVIASYIVDGKAVSDAEAKTIKLTVKGDNSTFERKGTVGEGTYKLDASKTPKTLDIIITKGPEKGKTYLSIYEVKDDSLRICHALPGNPRPKEFVSRKGTGNILEVWKRPSP